MPVEYMPETSRAWTEAASPNVLLRVARVELRGPRPMCLSYVRPRSPLLALPPVKRSETLSGDIGSASPPRRWLDTFKAPKIMFAI
jgi:hypothetical protein